MYLHEYYWALELSIKSTIRYPWFDIDVYIVGENFDSTWHSASDRNLLPKLFMVNKKKLNVTYLEGKKTYKSVPILANQKINCNAISIIQLFYEKNNYNQNIITTQKYVM